MQLVPAPLRQFHTYSMILIILTGIGDLAIVMMNTLSAEHVISTTTLALSNAVLMFLVGIVRLVRQTVPFTTTEKIDALIATAQQPLLPGERPIEVHVDGQPVAVR